MSVLSRSARQTRAVPKQPSTFGGWDSLRHSGPGTGRAREHDMQIEIPGRSRPLVARKSPWMTTFFTTLTCAWFVVACGPELETQEQPTEDALLTFPDLVDTVSHWVEVVLNVPMIPSNSVANHLENQLRAKGATDVIFIRELGVAFVRFDNPADATGLRVMSEVASVDPMEFYTVPGAPTPAQLRRGGVEFANELVAARASRNVVAPNASTVPAGAPAQVTPEDSLFEADWGLHRVRAPDVWRRGTGSAATVVAVIDQGVATNHPDLVGKVVNAQCFTLSSMSGVGPCQTYPTTGGHGTHVAATIAARFGGGATVGVGPDLALSSYNVFENAELYIDVNGDGIPDPLIYPFASEVAVLAAVVAAVNNGDRVINLSLGSVRFSPDGESDRARSAAEAWRRAATYAVSRGSILVASAGNAGAQSGADFGLPGMFGDLDRRESSWFPAETPLAITVGATGIRSSPTAGQPGSDVQAFYSNFGRVVDIAAPGGDLGPNFNDPSFGIVSAYIELDPFTDSIMAAFTGVPVAIEDPPCALAGVCTPGYAILSGTSMAAPHVAGSIGLLMDTKGYQAAAAAQILKSLSDPAIPGGKLGKGVLNLTRAMR